jgi:hypothetical protein
MKKQNPLNKIVLFGSHRIHQVPGFHGYYVGPDNHIYSAWGAHKKIIQPWYTKKKGKQAGRPRVCLVDNHGKRKNVLVENVLLWTIGEEEMKLRALRKAERDAAKESERRLEVTEDLGELF